MYTLSHFEDYRYEIFISIYYISFIWGKSTIESILIRRSEKSISTISCFGQSIGNYIYIFLVDLIIWLKLFSIFSWKSSWHKWEMSFAVNDPIFFFWKQVLLFDNNCWYSISKEFYHEIMNFLFTKDLELNGIYDIPGKKNYNS